MKKYFMAKCCVAVALLVSATTFAKAPAAMFITDESEYSTNALIHDTLTPFTIEPGSAQAVPWSVVTALCNNTLGAGGSNPCSIQVVAKVKDVWTKIAVATFFVSNGQVISIVPSGNAPDKLHVVSNGAGQLALVG